MGSLVARTRSALTPTPGPRPAPGWTRGTVSAEWMGEGTTGWALPARTWVVTACEDLGARLTPLLQEEAQSQLLGSDGWPLSRDKCGSQGNRIVCDGLICRRG